MAVSPSTNIEVDKKTILETCAVDGIFFSKYFFPKTVRQGSAPFHPRMWNALISIARYVAFKCFRGAAKTTLARLCIAHRISYAVSRTIMVVGESQDQAKKSTRWLRRQIMYNHKWTSFYRLRKGDKWTDEWAEIVNEAEGITITIIAVGITGQIRGVNIDDFRPDFIMADDPCDEENTGSPEQRKKTSNLFFGALAKTLAPRSEAPMAKMVLLQTPLVNGDLIDVCFKDPEWLTISISCFDEVGRSTWEVRFPTEELQRDKQAHINRNQLPLWLREMECKLVSENSSKFREEWLRYWEDMLPEGGFTVMYIDPVPPPSDKQIQQGLMDKDFEAFAVVKWKAGKIYLCETRCNKGHDPSWTIATFWELVRNWKVRKVRVETINYQRTLKWILTQSMQSMKQWVQLADDPENQNQKKMYRITDALGPVASNGAFYVNKFFHGNFITAFISYPDVEHDDELEAVAGAVKLAQEEAAYIDGDWEEVEDTGEMDKRVSFGGYAP